LTSVSNVIRGGKSARSSKVVQDEDFLARKQIKVALRRPGTECAFSFRIRAPSTQEALGSGVGPTIFSQVTIIRKMKAKLFSLNKWVRTGKENLKLHHLLYPQATQLDNWKGLGDCLGISLILCLQQPMLGLRGANLFHEALSVNKMIYRVRILSSASAKGLA